MTVYTTLSEIKDLISEPTKRERDLGELTGILERTAAGAYLHPDKVEEIIETMKVAVDAWLLGVGEVEK